MEKIQTSYKSLAPIIQYKKLLLFFKSNELYWETNFECGTRLEASARTVHGFWALQRGIADELPCSVCKREFLRLCFTSILYHRYTVKEHVNLENRWSCDIQRSNGVLLCSVEIRLQKLTPSVSATQLYSARIIVKRTPECKSLSECILQNEKMSAVPARVVLLLSSGVWDQGSCNQFWLQRIQTCTSFDPHHVRNFRCWNSVWEHDPVLELLHKNLADDEVRLKVRCSHCFKKWHSHSDIAVDSDFHPASPTDAEFMISGYECEGR